MNIIYSWAKQEGNEKNEVSEHFSSLFPHFNQMKEGSHLVFGLSESYSYSTDSDSSIVTVHELKRLPAYFVIMKMNAIVSNL